MVHYTCDACKRELDPGELRYTVKMEISAVFEPAPISDVEDDRDHLEEIQEILEQLEAPEQNDVSDTIHQGMSFDLCSECCRKLRKNPLGRDNKQLEFSAN